jgi:hypothetical protein
MRSRLKGWASAAVAAPLGLAAPAFAQEASEAPPTPEPTAQSGTVATSGERQVFTPADFARFAPKTARDMLDQVPGFAVETTVTARGLGQASGNVLINGERLSTKSASIADQLARIPASDVIRIELVDGATLDIPGLSGRVANIVSKASSDLSGQFEWNPQSPAKYSKFMWHNGRVSLTGRTGPVQFTLAAIGSGFESGSGSTNLIEYPDGTEEHRFISGYGSTAKPRLNGVVTIDGPGDSVINFNATYGWDVLRSRDVERGDPLLPDRLETVRSTTDAHYYEISGDIQFGVGPGKLKLIALDSFRSSDYLTRSIVALETAPNDTGSRFTLDSQSGERIARAEYSWPMLGGDWQLSAEAAFNRLDQVAGLSFLTPAGQFPDTPFAPGTGGVTEDRYEAVLSYGRPLTSNLTLQLSGGAEYSKIAQTGSNAEQRAFKRPKGSINLAWTPRPDLSISLQARRRVGQLNFADFLAEVNLNNDNASTGNNQLVPEQRSELDLEITKDFGEWGSATMLLFTHRIDDYVTFIPLPGGGESTGNIDHARNRGGQIDATWKLDPLGFKGAKLDIFAHYFDTKLADPLTGEPRRYNNGFPYKIQLDFRHDVPRSPWAYGVSYGKTTYAPYYRLAEFGYDYAIDQALVTFIEHKNVFGLTVRARMANMLQSEVYLQRNVFAGPRNSAPLLYRETMPREVGRFVDVSIKGSF